MRPPENIFTDISCGDEGNNLHNLCMAPAPAPCIAVLLYRCIAF